MGRLFFESIAHRTTPCEGSVTPSPADSGPGNFQRCSADLRDNGDPFLFIEAIPTDETRAFVAHVLTCSWIYASRLHLPATSLDELAAGEFPRFTPRPGTGKLAAATTQQEASVPGIDQTRSFIPVNIAVLTVSDTRTLANDTSGDTLAQRIAKSGHVVKERALDKDDAALIVARLRAWIANPEIDVVITTGGTGVTGRDVTPEAFDRVLDKRIEGFGELFRMLSYQKIGTSTMQSRAIGGVAGGTYLFALPGSTGAVKDGWDDILVHQLDNRFRPCNLVELMPRLQEHLKPPGE